MELARNYGTDRTVRIERTNPRAVLDVLRADGTDGYDAVIEATGALSVAEMCVPLTEEMGAQFSNMVWPAKRELWLSVLTTYPSAN